MKTLDEIINEKYEQTDRLVLSASKYHLSKEQIKEIGNEYASQYKSKLDEAKGLLNKARIILGSNDYLFTERKIREFLETLNDNSTLPAEMSKSDNSAELRSPEG